MNKTKPNCFQNGNTTYIPSLGKKPSCFKKKNKCEDCPWKDDCDNYGIWEEAYIRPYIQPYQPYEPSPWRYKIWSR